MDEQDAKLYAYYGAYATSSNELDNIKNAIIDDDGETGKHPVSDEFVINMAKAFKETHSYLPKKIIYTFSVVTENQKLIFQDLTKRLPESWGRDEDRRNGCS